MASKGIITLPCWALPNRQKLAISIEAEADEPFSDQLVREHYDRRRTMPGVSLPTPTDGLSRTLFQHGSQPRITAALISAKQHGADVAMFLRLDAVKLATNQSDCQSFLATILRGCRVQSRLNRRSDGYKSTAASTRHADIRFYVGKIQTVLP